MEKLYFVVSLFAIIHEHTELECVRTPFIDISEHWSEHRVNLSAWLYPWWINN